jgi:hypothetical protein
MFKSLCMLAVVAAGQLCGCLSGPRAAPKVLLYVRPGSEDMELMLTKEVGVPQMGSHARRGCPGCRTRPGTAAFLVMEENFPG